MQLLLLRHANADSPAPSDDLRPLTTKGRAQARRTALFCCAHGLLPEIFLSSPILRARQTAEEFAHTAKITQAEIASFLACGMDPETALNELRAYQSFPSVLLVGHEPDLSSLAAHLLGLPLAQNLHVRKATLLVLEVEHLRLGGASLELLIPCSFMPDTTSNE